MKYQYMENKKEERSIELKETGIIYTSTKTGEHTIPYSDIKKINLLCPMKDIYVCNIIAAGKPKIAIANRSFISFDHFEYRTDEYTRFIFSLHNRLKEYSSIEYSCGSSFLYYFMLITIPIIFIVLAAAVILAYQSGRSLPFSPFIGLLIIVPLAVHYIKKGKKIIYVPENIPSKYLP